MKLTSLLNISSSIFKTFFENPFQKKNIAIVLSGAFLLFVYRTYTKIQQDKASAINDQAISLQKAANRKKAVCIQAIFGYLEWLKEKTGMDYPESTVPSNFGEVLYTLAEELNPEAQFGEYQYFMAQAAIKGHKEARAKFGAPLGNAREISRFNKWTDEQQGQVTAFRAKLSGEKDVFPPEESGKSEE